MLDHDLNLESFFDQTCRNINQVILMKSIGTDGAAGFCVRINQIQPCEIHPEVGCQQKTVCIMIVGLP